MVSTTDPEHRGFWVVGGGTGFNFYLKERFKTPADAYAYHAFIFFIALNKSSKFKVKDEVSKLQIWDAFICHASEDKDSVVRPLAMKLEEIGFRIWYDEFELKVGDSLRRSIDRGLLKSKYGIVVLSKDFFAKGWTQYELDGLVTLEIEGIGKILPIWHGVTKKDVINYSPSLANKVALNTSKLSIQEIANSIIGVFWTRNV